MEGMDDPLDFTAIEIQKLDENLRCPICKEFFETAMILSTCSHTFCAMCIRRSLAAEPCCPKCRTPSHDSKLHNNYDLDNIVHSWKLSRKIILSLEESHAKMSKSTPVTSVSSSSSSTTVTNSTEYRHTIQDDSDGDFMPVTETSSTRRSTRLKTTAFQSQVFGEDPDMVTCPICQQKMHMNVLNQHVDRCLEGDSTIPPLPTIPKLAPPKINTGKKPIKIVYDMYKERDLRRMLRNLDIPDNGDRAQLVWRYKEYVTMYNANMDSSNPVDIRQLIRQLKEAEQLQFSSKAVNKRSATDVEQHNILFV